MEAIAQKNKLPRAVAEQAVVMWGEVFFSCMVNSMKNM